MTPKIRIWKVNWYAGARLVCSLRVSAPTRYFARWVANRKAWGLQEMKRLEIKKADRQTIQ